MKRVPFHHSQWVAHLLVVHRNNHKLLSSKATQEKDLLAMHHQQTIVSLALPRLPLWNTNSSRHSWLKNFGLLFHEPVKRYKEMVS